MTDVLKVIVDQIECYEYSNMGLVIALYVVEIVSFNSPYSAVVRPLSMDIVLFAVNGL